MWAFAAAFAACAHVALAQGPSGPNPFASCANLKVMQQTASAFWVDSRAKINGTGAADTTSVAGILADAASRSPPPTVVFIVYDVPNRDCHAKASNGEICCTYNADRSCDYDAGGDCAAGIAEYETTFVDPLVALFGAYAGKVPIVAVVEPDSLPNLATNTGDPHCGNSATSAAYRIGIPYAVAQIGTKAPAVSMYLDAAHGGWLGWENNAQDFVSLVAGLGITQYLRGFSTNVANYQPLGTPCRTFDYCLNGAHPSDPCCKDACHLESQYDPAASEHLYVQLLEHYFQSALPNAKFIIDTGRNGVDGMRSECANWCNIRGAGVGRLPTAATDLPAVDAYFWLKTPGESDGCTATLPSPPGGACARFDSFCGSSDSIGSRAGEPFAPVAGGWFDYAVQGLATLADFNSTR